MPRITLVGVPSPGASAIDYAGAVHLLLGESTDADEQTVARLRELEPLGYRFEVDQENAPAVAGGLTPDPATPAATTTDAPPAQ